jgi:hypothetical protein
LLGFAVHRPGIPVASPRSHRMPCGDVPGRIHVGIAGITAGRATEVRLVLTRLSVHAPARRATLARESGSYLLDSASSFMLQSVHQGTPARAQDSEIQAGLLANVAPRHCSSTLPGARHRPNVQVFDKDQVELGRQPSGQLLAPVLAPIPFSRSQPGCLGLDLRSSLRSPLGVRKLALEAFEPPLFSIGEPRHHEHFPCRQRRTDRYAKVNSNEFTIARGRKRVRNRSESYVPTPSPVLRNTEGLRFLGHGTRPAKPNPADFWYPDLAHVAIQATDIRGLDRYYPESFGSSSLPPRRLACGSPEEPRHSLRVVAERLLLHYLATRTQPRVLRARLSELAALFQVARSTTPTWPPPRLLFHRQVPHVPRMLAMLQQHRFLFACRR